MEGWIRLHRRLKEHWIWKSNNRLKWWIDILLTVNYTDNKVLIKGNLIDCKRGQSIRSLETWAKDWNVTKGAVRDFFKLLEKDQMIRTESLHITTRITVLNYDSYQDELHAEETQRKRRGNAEETQRVHNKEREEIEEIKKENKYFKSDRLDSLFIDFLDFRKKIKKPATDRAIQLLKNELCKLSLDESVQCEIIEQSIMRGWQGFFELKTNGKQFQKVMP